MTPAPTPRITRSVPALRGAILFFLLASFSFSMLHAQQVTIAGMGTTVLKSTADGLVATQKYAQAIPYLEELYSRIQNNPAAGDEMEKTTYALGLSYISVNDYQNAIKYLDIYLEKFKDKNVTRTTRATDMLAESLYATQDYVRAAKIYAEYANDRHTPEDRKRVARINLIDCYTQMKRWDRLIKLGKELVKESRDTDMQSRAAVALCQSYVETEQPEKVFELIPILENGNSTARFRADYNLSMISAGDRMFQAGKLDMALPLYQLAAPKRLIERLINERIEQLNKQKDELAAQKPPPPNLGLLNATLKNQSDKLTEQLEKLNDAESYDEALRTRIAQTLYQQGRRWEALWVYEQIMDDFPDSEYGEKAGYSAFAIAAELGQRDRAILLGKDYIDRFPKGENYETLTWQLAQTMVTARQFKEAMEMIDKTIKDKPDHIFADKMLFLTGYSLFQGEEMEKSGEVFLRLRRDYPQSESREASDYWYAMTMLFQSKYEEAYQQFKLFTETYPQGTFHNDAAFRMGVCQYAMEKYDDANKTFEEFLTKYPEAPQVAEAHLLLGDIAGNDSRLKDALEHYRKVDRFTINQGNIDYATMAAGRVYEAMEDWDGMISWFTHYLDVYGTNGLYAEAIYRIGFGKKQKGDIKGLLSSYLDAIKKYGNKPDAIGVDLITKDWPMDYRGENGKFPLEIVNKELVGAYGRGEKTMTMRWMMVIDAMNKEAGTTATTPPPMEVTAAELELCSPAMLVWQGDKARDKKDLEFARKAYELVFAKYTENEWYLPALMALARMDAEEGNFPKAAERYGKVRELFPTSEEAATALYEQAMVLAKQKKYAEAIDLLQLILEVKEWRGEPWAQALYTIGDLLREQGKNEEAFNYYQRVYVLYSAYKGYAAKAYMQSAKCLAALGKNEERIKTLQEMVSNQGLRDQPEYSEAEKLLSHN